MQEYFDGPRAVAVKMPFQVGDGLVALLPDDFFVAQFFGKSLAAENLRMHPNH